MGPTPPPPEPLDDAWPDEPAADSDELTAPQIRFVLACFDGKRLTDAYELAGFPPVTRESARVMAFRLAQRPHIRAYMQKVRQQAADAAQVHANEVVALAAAIARFNPKLIMDRDGLFLPLDQWPDSIAMVVESIQSDEVYEPVPGAKGQRRLAGFTRKVKFASRLGALRLLAEIKELVGQNKSDTGKAKPDPLVVGGEADPDKL